MKHINIQSKKQIILIVLNLFLASLAQAQGDNPYCENSYCGTKETCCTLDNGSPGCCNLPNATCCGIDNACCAFGTLCDPVAGRCVPEKNSTMCSTCLMVVNFVVQHGCSSSLCTTIPPPADALCAYFMTSGLCEKIINWVNKGTPIEKACFSMGLCGSGTCACGYCTRYQYGRCLSVPNHCPSHVNTTLLQQKIPPSSSKLDICWNGVCSPDTEGCCNTCF